MYLLPVKHVLCIMNHLYSIHQQLMVPEAFAACQPLSPQHGLYFGPKYIYRCLKGALPAKRFLERRSTSSALFVHRECSCWLAGMPGVRMRAAAKNVGFALLCIV